MDHVTPDSAQFHKFDDELREAMRREGELFFEAVVREDRSILEFLDADWTFVNPRLADHYGIEVPQGDDHGHKFQRVSLTGGPRGGVVTMAAVLTVTSNPTRTSPVKRGKWVLENILGAAPPPPPPDIPELDESPTNAAASLRQRLEQHRANPNCAVCHSRMDPLGFALENFDAIGAWRQHEGEHFIDVTGALPNGETIHGPAGLKAVLMQRKDQFLHCFSEKMLTYALGRGLEHYDYCTVADICDQVRQSDYRFSSVVLGIVSSDAFLKRRRAGAGP